MMHLYITGSVHDMSPVLRVIKVALNEEPAPGTQKVEGDENREDKPQTDFHKYLTNPSKLPFSYILGPHHPSPMWPTYLK